MLHAVLLRLFSWTFWCVLQECCPAWNLKLLSQTSCLWKSAFLASGETLSAFLSISAEQSSEKHGIQEIASKFELSKFMRQIRLQWAILSDFLLYRLVPWFDQLPKDQQEDVVQVSKTIFLAVKTCCWTADRQDVYIAARMSPAKYCGAAPNHQSCRLIPFKRHELFIGVKSCLNDGLTVLKLQEVFRLLKTKTIREFKNKTYDLKDVVKALEDTTKTGNVGKSYLQT